MIVVWSGLAGDFGGVVLFLVWLVVPPLYVVVLGKRYVRQCQENAEAAVWARDEVCSVREEQREVMTVTLVSDDDRGKGVEKRVPLLDDPKVAAETQEFVNDQAPRVFAVVRETFVPEDVKIVAWGMTTRKGAEVVAVQGGMHLSVQSPENALIFFQAGGHAVARVVWVGGEDDGR